MINRNQVAMRVGDVSFSFSPTGGAVVSLGYEVYSIQLGDVIYRGVERKTVPTLPKIESAATVLYANAQARFEDYMARHESYPQIGGYSPHDADLILDSWWFGNGDNMSHPICGNFDDVEYDPSSYVSLVNAILDRVPAPPLWFWAEPVSSTQLRVRCVAVSGADSYNVYNGDELLGNVPTAGWQTLSVPAGTYSVREAAVVDGQVGTPSFPVSVTVNGAALAAAGLDVVNVTAARMSTGKRKLFGLWDRFRRWLVYGA